MGGRGTDIVFMGAGDDTFVWNPGDGSDVVEGQGGTDTLVFNGANIAENMEISANGSRARLTRNVGTVTMDFDGIEHIQLAAEGGVDLITVDDLTGTAVKQAAIDLSGTPGSGRGDGAADTVAVNGTAGDDRIGVTGNGSSVVVNGLAAQVTIAGADAGTDTLAVNGGNGNDTINASGVHGQINLTLNGGDGNDSIVGSAGNDTVIGGRGNDVASLGAGDDSFVWNPGDGSDTVNGGSGNDTLVFNGANVDEKFDISANAGRAILTRDVGVVTMNMDNTETLDVNTLSGADTVTVNDLSRTDVQHVAIDLSGTPGSGQGDGVVDTVVINATSGADAITVTDDNGVVTVSGLGADIRITGFDATDRLVINGLGGDDAIVASGLNGAMQLVANGGDGDDVLIGSRGNDTLNGGAGDDVLIGNGGQDILDGGTGSNQVINAPVIAGSQVTAAALMREAMASSFVTPGDGHGSVPFADPLSGQPPPQLALPHAA
jgi:Ca2+-binding RTX toxin-like protein